MVESALSRRSVLKGGIAAGMGGLTVVQVAGPARAFPGARSRGGPAPVVVPWIDQPAPVPEPARSVVGNLLRWEQLDSFVTPNDEFFTVQHYGIPSVDPATYRLTVDGLVAAPQSLSLAQLRARPRQAVDYTLECAGNHGLPFFHGGIGHARWSGTSLRRLLREARPRPGADEVVFWGADRGEVTLRDNAGITGGGTTGRTGPDQGGGLDLTVTEQFARSMSLADALAPEMLLCDRMNGAPLPREHGAPVRLIAPGWYGVANVKWLTRIQLTDQRFAGRFMARDYVTVREEQRGGQTVWTFSTVERDRLKSAPARVLRRGDRYVVTGAAWGAPIGRVEVQIDGGAWRPAKVTRHRLRTAPRGDLQGFAWNFWTFDWGRPAAGEHSVRSRAVSLGGQVQPPPEHPSVTSRRTYWEANAQITRRVRIP